MATRLQSDIQLEGMAARLLTRYESVYRNAYHDTLTQRTLV